MLYIPDVRVSQKRDIETIYKACLNDRKGDLYIAFLDANGLKTINDRYGHLMGDKVITAMQNAICDNVHKNDSIVRFGGDEFIIFLNNSTKDKVEYIIKNLQEQFRMDNALSTIPSGCSVSVGVVKYDSVKNTSIIELIDAADKLMYQAKNNPPYYYMYSEDLDNIICMHSNQRGYTNQSTRLRDYFRYIAGAVLGENSDLTRDAVVNQMRYMWNTYGDDLLYKYTVDDIIREIVEECKSKSEAA